MPLKMSYGTKVKQPPHSLESSRVGNLIMVEWSLKYVASKSVLCFISINARNTSYLWKKNKIQNVKIYVGKFWENLFIVKKFASWAY